MKRLIGFLAFACLLPALVASQGVATVPLGEVVHIEDLNLFDSMGELVAADSTVPCAIYEEANDTAILTYNLAARAALTGEYRGTFTASTANGFEIGKWYNNKCRPTVGGLTQTVNKGHFRIIATEGNIYQRGVAVADFKFQMFTSTNAPCLGKAAAFTAKQQILGTAGPTTIAGTIVEQGLSFYYIPLTAAEMDAQEIGFSFAATGCRTTTFKIRTQGN